MCEKSKINTLGPNYTQQFEHNLDGNALGNVTLYKIKNENGKGANNYQFEIKLPNNGVARDIINIEIAIAARCNIDDLDLKIETGYFLLEEQYDEFQQKWNKFIVVKRDEERPIHDMLIISFNTKKIEKQVINVKDIVFNITVGSVGRLSDINRDIIPVVRRRWLLSQACDENDRGRYDVEYLETDDVNIATEKARSDSSFIMNSKTNEVIWGMRNANNGSPETSPKSIEFTKGQAKYTLKIDGVKSVKVLNKGEEAFDDRGIIMVPVAYIAKVFGYQVEWQSNANLLTMKKGKDIYTIEVGNCFANDSMGVGHYLGRDAVSKNGRVFVAYCCLGEILNCGVKWNDDSKTVTFYEN
ncbi:MAG: stalk domain-containing protein [Cellulosilyticaceae bacterium]